jgi:hypothetical protein
VATEAQPAKQAKLLVVEDDALIRMLLAREDADAPHPPWLLRACRERPRDGRAAEQRERHSARTAHGVTTL